MKYRETPATTSAATVVTKYVNIVVTSFLKGEVGYTEIILAKNFGGASGLQKVSCCDKLCVVIKITTV